MSVIPIPIRTQNDKKNLLGKKIDDVLGSQKLKINQTIQKLNKASFDFSLVDGVLLVQGKWCYVNSMWVGGVRVPSMF